MTRRFLHLRWPAWMLAAFVLVAVAERTRPVGWFVVNQLQLDYQLEFVRRGLFGEALRVLGVPRTVTTAWWMGWVLAAGLAAASWAFFMRMSQPVTAGRDGARPSTPRADGAVPSTPRADRAVPSTVTPLMFAFLLSPATFLQAGYDFGRLDAMLIAITMLMLVTHDSGREAVLLDIVLVVAATLSHEIFFVTSVPFIVMAFLVLAIHRPALRTRLVARAATVVATSAIAGLVVMRHGNIDTLTFDQYVAVLASRGRLGGNDPTAIAVAFRTLGDSMAYAASRYASKPLLPAVISVGVAVATMVGAWLALRGRSALTTPLLVVAAITPLLLVPIGHDYGRWLAMSMANTLMALAVASHATSTAPNRRIAWLGLAALAGPLGANIVLPWWG